jgi:hypothetical protein
MIGVIFVQYKTRSRFALVIVLIIALAIVSYWHKSSGIVTPPNQENQFPVLTAQPSMIELGKVVQGGNTNCTFTLKNQTQAFVDVSEIKTSFDCLQLQTFGFIAPGETKSVSILVDFKKAPDFVGGLAIEVEGKTKTGCSAFKVMCQIDVLPP